MTSHSDNLISARPSKLFCTKLHYEYILLSNYFESAQFINVHEKKLNSLKFWFMAFINSLIVLADIKFWWKIGQYFQQGSLPCLHDQESTPSPQGAGILPLYSAPLHLKMKSPIKKWTSPTSIGKCSASSEIIPRKKSNIYWKLLYICATWLPHG